MLCAPRFPVPPSFAVGHFSRFATHCVFSMGPAAVDCCAIWAQKRVGKPGKMPVLPRAKLAKCPLCLWAKRAFCPRARFCPLCPNGQNGHFARAKWAKWAFCPGQNGQNGQNARFCPQAKRAFCQFGRRVTGEHHC
eukprot:gene24131-biopygen1328